MLTSLFKKLFAKRKNVKKLFRFSFGYFTRFVSSLVHSVDFEKIPLQNSPEKYLVRFQPELIFDAIYF